MHLNMIYAGNEGFKIEIYLKEIGRISSYLFFFVFE